MSNVNDILKLIEETKKEASFGVFAPSIQKDVKFFPLNANDQKELVKALIDSPIYSTAFNVKFTEMLKAAHDSSDGVSDEEFENLSIFDKTLFTLKVRSENIGDNYTYKFNKNGNEVEKVISLESHYNKVKDTKLPEPVEIEVDGYKAVLNYPTIKTDVDVERYILEELTKLSKKQDSNVKQMIGTLFLANVIKYIEELSIKETNVGFKDLSLPDKMNIGSSFLSIFTRKVIEKIDSHFGKGIEKLLEYSFQHDGEKVTNVISIDNTFFLT